MTKVIARRPDCRVLCRHSFSEETNDIMAFVITEPCIGCKDQSCVPVCPVEAIHPGIFKQASRELDQLFIDPEACICCGLCEVECPVDAIFADDEVPAVWEEFIQINAQFYRKR